MRYQDKFQGCFVGGNTGEVYFTLWCLFESESSKYSEGSKESIKNFLKIIRDTYPVGVEIKKEQCSELEAAELFVMFLYHSPRAMKYSSFVGKYKVGTVYDPVNDSKGCEGLLRVAPIGLYFSDIDDASYAETDMMGAEVAAMSNGHELGFIPAAALAHIIRALSEKTLSVKDAVNEALATTVKLFMESDYIDEFESIMKKAIELSESDRDDEDAIHQLGEGKSADEILAIAVYCALKYENDFETAVRTASDNSIDSDSACSVCGFIAGTYLGYKAFSHYPKYSSDQNITLYMVASAMCQNAFENFRVNEDNCQAKSYAEYFAENIDSKPLCIFGKHGTGKTLLLYAVSNYIHEHNPELNIIMTNGRKFSKDILDSVKIRKDLRETREKYRKCDVLLFDDIDFIAGKDLTIEEFVLLYNELYESGKRILLTSSGIKDFKSDDARYISRCFFGDAVVIRGKHC